MIAEFITALPTIISLLEKEGEPLTPVTPPSPITPLPDFVPTAPSLVPLAEFTYDLPPTFEPWWLKENGYKGIEPIPVPKKKDCNPYLENCLLV